MNTEELRIMLERGIAIEAAVAAMSSSICAPNKSNPYAAPGLVYEPVENGMGFKVRLHGLAIVPKYEQVKDGEGQFPALFGRITLCFADDEGYPGKPLLKILINPRGHFSLDGTKNFDYGIGEDVLDHARLRLSLTIAEAVQAEIPIL
ncbi:hypothetical protein SBC1_08860 [Caballeronia sp. SBC1]|uniref:hypothetical protein n=1 Tax=Caballeronia sp. SBC1 TaxID=2705548 RepID=UPI00140D131B|nr:hypothetical protein [Caballeronia sp. SBC1]QIN60907.1 hypothetical protein SBC1_08860 [Caballeronia sp. SBC1]